MGTPVKASTQVVVLGKALNLAEQWVNNMKGSTAKDLPETEMVGRPARLGLGAKYTPQLKAAASVGPLERRLRSKMEAMKKRAAKNLEEDSKIDQEEEEVDDDNSDSRTHTFTKKRPQSPFLSTCLQTKKKHR